MNEIDRAYEYEEQQILDDKTLTSAEKSKLIKDNSISIVFFGDGACEEGTFHESLNFASLHSLPIIFVAENNLFSSHLDIHLRQPSNKLSRYAEAHKIENFVVDGNDVCEINRLLKSKIKEIRKRNGPLFIECITYRHLGHVGPADDIDVGVNRKLSDLKLWKKNDPILRLKKSLKNENLIKDKEIFQIEKNIGDKIEQTYKQSKKIPLKRNKLINNYIY